MPVQNVFQNALQPKSIQDFDNEAMQAQQSRMALQTNALALQDKQQAMADDAALRSATKQFGNDPAAARNALVQTGNYKAVQQWDKAQLDKQKATADINHVQAQTKGLSLDQVVKGSEFMARSLDNVKSPADAIKWYRHGISAGLTTPEDALQELQEIPTDPAGFQDWVKTKQAKGVSVTDQLKQRLDQQKFGLQSANEIMTPDGNGGYTQNQPLVDAKRSISKAGAANVSVKVDNKLGESVATQIGPMLRESYEAATGAQQQVTTADNLIKAIDSGKAMTGPGASWRLKAAQIGQTLGVAGKDTAEQIANTRAVIQNLAQSTVAARGQLKGQGQVSDYEGKLLTRAASGDIDEMTSGEIRQIAEVNKRLAQTQIGLHGQRVEKLKAKDATAPIAQFYELGTMPPAAASAPATAAPVAPAAAGQWKYVGPVK